jgi:heme/copper-type cytochrome/quinol oxidase subunit 2
MSIALDPLDDDKQKLEFQEDKASTKLVLYLMIANVVVLLVVMASFNIIRRCRGDSKKKKRKNRTSGPLSDPLIEK